jgi:type I restriction enzyme S subunit
MELVTEEKKGFKKTELGEFPEDWILKPICESTNYVDYRGATPKKVDHGITLVTAKNIKKGYIDYSESKEYVESENYDEIMSRGKPEIGDVLITTEAPLGHVAAVDNTNIALAQRVIKYRAIESFLENDYLKYFFLSDRFQENLHTNSSGSTATGIKGSVLHKLPICFPPTLEEQQAIASALGDVDQLIRSLDGLFQKKEAIKKGTMQQLLTGKKRLPGFDGDWEVKALEEMFEISAGGDLNKGSFSESKTEKYRYPVYANSLTNKGLYGYYDVYGQNRNKITVTARGTLGKAFYREEEFSAIGRLLVLDAKKEIDCRFVTESINETIHFSIESTGVPQLTAPQISNYEIKIPVKIKEQKAIAQILSDMDREIQVLRQKREKTGQIKQGMMQELLTGKTRLV